MGDEIKKAPEQDDVSIMTEKMAEALKVELTEDEPAPDPSNEEGSKEKPENKETGSEVVGEGKKNEEKVEIDPESLKIEVEELRKVKGKLGEELGLARKEAEYNKKLYEALISKTPEKKEEVEDRFAKLSTITDPAAYAKAVVDLAKEGAQNIIESRDKELAYKAEVWSSLTTKFPDLADRKSDLYIQTDALMKARNIGLKDGVDKLEIVVDYVNSQLKLAGIEKEKADLIEAERKRKIAKEKQGGSGSQPVKTGKDSPKWDAMSEKERRAAVKIGLGPKDFEEAE